jgi:hypothetical protein
MQNALCFNREKNDALWENLEMLEEICPQYAKKKELHGSPSKI